MPKTFQDVRQREHEIRETLLSIVTGADPAYLSNVALAQFEQGLIDEVHFLLPGDAEDMQAVEHHIHQHGTELYQIARTRLARPLKMAQ